MLRLTRALLTVSDKTGLVDFARALHGAGVELVSTGGTAALLRGAGLPVRDVSEVTGQPEILDGRVKTINPILAGGILYRRGVPKHEEELAASGGLPIDLVCVNLYPFEATTRKSDVPLEGLVEQIDIGGPTLIRAAAKNWEHVAVVVDQAQYAAVVEEIATHGGLSRRTRWHLARAAFARTAAYDAAIATHLSTLPDEPPDPRAVPTPSDADRALPPLLVVPLVRRQTLRYGENPHQAGALYAEWAPAGEAGRLGGAFREASSLQGKGLSYTNLLDLDAAWGCARDFDRPAAAIIKHTNPCGVALGATAAEAIERAREVDPESAFGGIVGVNRPVDADAARVVSAWFVEAVVAPAFTPEARAILAEKKNLRLVEAAPSPERFLAFRSIDGALLVQEADAGRRVRAAEARVVTRRAPTPEELAALDMAWTCVPHVKSNAIVFAGPDRLLAIGAGQMSRVDAAKVAVSKARFPLAGSAVASDAFFPFPDGLLAVVDAGATAVIQPGGSVRDEEVIAAADSRGIAMLFTGRRHFRH
ncbi:MAG TPA: bifunctional phosphoribosylaminoimidazolecarboxamide formyltransferase/IMP cyclohydrolase [Thermodesulfobacteriota bacterium]